MINQFKQHYPILNSLTEAQLGLITGLFPSCRNGVETLSVRVENKDDIVSLCLAYGYLLKMDFGECPYMVDLHSLKNSIQRFYAFNDPDILFSGYYVSMNKVTHYKKYIISEDKTKLTVDKGDKGVHNEHFTTDLTYWEGRKEVADLAKSCKGTLCSYRDETNQSYLHINL